jgi:hypothetical protein
MKMYDITTLYTEMTSTARFQCDPMPIKPDFQVLSTLFSGKY